MRAARRIRDESGQATVEWTGAVLLVAFLVLGVASAVGARPPGTALARAVAERIVCAAGLGEEGCAGIPDPELTAEYGAELAAEVRRRTPTLAYEDGMRVLPVDFRTCRENACSWGPASGAALASQADRPVTLFVHVVDCRAEAAEASADAGYLCTGGREGSLFIQYWAYYPSSASLRALPGDTGYHRDDWEGFQLRITPEGTLARASSHHGYAYRAGTGNWPSDAGLTHQAAWGPPTGRYYVSANSHAGHVWEEPGPLRRWTPAKRVRLVPLEAIAGSPWGEASFGGIVPPWRKQVYLDGENQGTE